MNTVLVNPALTPDGLEKYIGTVPVYDTDRTFEWTRRSIAELRSIGETVNVAVSPKSDVDWKNTLLLVSEHDEVIPYEIALKAMPYATQVIDRVQEHRFSDLMAHAEVIRSTLTSK